MELPVEVIHFTIAGIFLKKFGVLRYMEPADIGLIELLHPGHLKQAVIVVAHTLVPFKRSAFSTAATMSSAFDDVIGNIEHISSQDTFIDAREALAA